MLFESDATDLIAGQNFPAGDAALPARHAGGRHQARHAQRRRGLPGGDADPSGYGFSRDGKTVVFAAKAPVAGRRRHQQRRRRLHVRAGDRRADARLGRDDRPVPGRGREPWTRRSAPTAAASRSRSTAKNLLAEPLTAAASTPTGVTWSTGTTKLVDRKWDKPVEAASGATGGARISADGAIVLFETSAARHRRGLRRADRPGRATSQLYLRDMTTDGAAVLVTAAHDGATSSAPAARSRTRSSPATARP